MNAMAPALLWCVVQVTLAGLLVAGLYAAARWLRPNAASLVVLTGLATVAVLSAFAFAPWPRWAAHRDRPADAVAQSAPADGRAADAPSTSALLWQALAQGRGPRTVVPGTAWRWPAVAAVLLLAAAAAGLGWLVLGLAAVAWQRRCARRVSDGPLSAVVDALRKELGCARPIEIRQSEDLASAATIGWLRPVVLLPPDWPEWSPIERRAILAHEIAHVRSNDFLWLVVGQLALALHFYHPLLHWLMSRLRSEQELAADAAAATVSGGQGQYLATIARLALAQHARAPVWPARSFLPTRNTFLRRIAMLRDGKLPAGRLSSTARLTTMGAVLACGLAAAGFRGPAASSLAADDSAPNILVNPGAEDGKTAPDGWRPGAPIPGVRYSWDKRTGCRSRASLCIEKVAQRYFPIAQWSQTVARTGELAQLEVSAQVKAQNAGKAILDVIFLDKDGEWISHQWAAYIGSKQPGDPPANHDWREYAGKVTIPEGTAQITIGLQDYGPGRVWFDDVRAAYAK